jgi:hypothetical protein
MGFDNEDRKSFRATIVDRCEGTLLVGEAQIRVCLVDQSATGFKLSTDDRQPIPVMVDALLDVNDGVQHTVRIVRVEQVGDRRMLGLKLCNTRLRLPCDSSSIVKARRATAAKASAALLLVVVSAIALQAAPIRNQLAKISLFRFLAHQEPATKSGDLSSKRAPVPKLDRDRPFDFRRYLEEDTADWLQLAKAQRSLMRGLLDVCAGARENRLAPAQRAYVDFAAQASMLELLNAEQRSRLEGELNRPLRGAALLQDVIRSYSAQVSPEELAKQFGVLLFVSPEIAERCGVSAEATAAICKRVDEAFQSSAKSAQPTPGGVDANQVVFDFSLRIKQLEANCRTLIVPSPAKPAP